VLLLHPAQIIRLMNLFQDLLVLLRSLVFGLVSGKFRPVVARFLFFEPNIELQWMTRASSTRKIGIRFHAKSDNGGRFVTRQP